MELFKEANHNHSMNPEDILLSWYPKASPSAWWFMLFPSATLRCTFSEDWVLLAQAVGVCDYAAALSLLSPVLDVVYRHP